MRTIRLSEPLNNRLRIAAFAQHKTGEKLITEAITAHLDRLAADDSYLASLMRVVSKGR